MISHLELLQELGVDEAEVQEELDRLATALEAWPDLPDIMEARVGSATLHIPTTATAPIRATAISLRCQCMILPPLMPTLGVAFWK